MGVLEREEEGMKGLFLICVFTIKTFITLTLEVCTFLYILRYFFKLKAPKGSYHTRRRLQSLHWSPLNC